MKSVAAAAPVPTVVSNVAGGTVDGAQAVVGVAAGGTHLAVGATADVLTGKAIKDAHEARQLKEQEEAAAALAAAAAAEKAEKAEEAERVAAAEAALAEAAEEGRP